jgi:CDP-diglyceride synthetase
MVIGVNEFRILSTLIILSYGFGVLWHLIKYWNNPNKIRSRNSEIVYVIEFFIIGIYTYFLFSSESISAEVENFLYMSMFIIFLAINFWLYVVNIIPTYLKVKKHPELLEHDPVMTRKYDEFLQILDRKYENKKNDDIIKDLTRKALHLVMFSLILGIDWYAHLIEPQLAEFGLTPIAFRNFLYISLAMFFVFMFTIADLLRITKFHVLPDWARKWYSKSLEAKSESYTLISSVPFLLTTLMFINAPVQVLFGASVVSCIADAAASVVGKNFGKHKMKNFGRYPHKSFEGLVAGALFSFAGVILIFKFYPLAGLNEMVIYLCALLSALAFVYIDAFAEKLCDNILNTLVPGLLIWVCIAIF